MERKAQVGNNWYRLTETESPYPYPGDKISYTCLYKYAASNGKFNTATRIFIKSKKHCVKWCFKCIQNYLYLFLIWVLNFILCVLISCDSLLLLTLCSPMVHQVSSVEFLHFSSGGISGGEGGGCAIQNSSGEIVFFDHEKYKISTLIEYHLIS